MAGVPRFPERKQLGPFRSRAPPLVPGTSHEGHWRIELLSSGFKSSARKKGKEMKRKSVFHTLFVLTACAILPMVTAGCPLPILPGNSSTASTGSITGKVLAPGQADNSGVTVTAEPTDGIRSVSIQKAISSRQASKAASAAQATTDASGAYTLSGLAPGIYTLNAVSKDGTAKAIATSLTVGAGSTTQALLMTLMRTGQIQGNVTLGDGSDPTGIVVFIAGTSCSAMTDRGGNYLMSWVPAGTNYTLVMSKVGWVSAICNVDVAVNRTTPVASIVLAPYVAPQTTGSVSGTVTLKDSPTHAGVFVYLAGTSFISVTDADGKFNLTGVTPGSYTIVASKEGYSAQSTSVIVPAGPAGPVSFTLARMGPFFVTYDGNGGVGSVPVDPTNYMLGATVTVPGNSGNLAKAGYSFAGWNMQADGGGITYTQGQTFFMGSSNVVLYAVWTKVIIPINVTGYWNLTVTQEGQQPMALGMMYVRQTGSTLSGLMLSDVPLIGSIDGSSVTFASQTGMAITFQGTATDAGIAGTVTAPGVGQGTFEMVRSPVLGHLDVQGSCKGVPLSINTDYPVAKKPVTNTNYSFGFDLVAIPGSLRFDGNELSVRSYTVDPKANQPGLMAASVWQAGPPVNASGGTVNVTAYDGAGIEGNFNLTFPDGSYLTGSFDLVFGAASTVSVQGSWLGNPVQAPAPVPTFSYKDVRTMSFFIVEFFDDQIDIAFWLTVNGVIGIGDYPMPNEGWLGVQMELMGQPDENVQADLPGNLHITSCSATGIAGSFTAGFSAGGAISGSFSLNF